MGGGDVIVNNSLIMENYGDGVNMSISGQGIKHVDRSVISQNSNRGIAIFYNESREAGSNFLHKNKIFSHVTFTVISMNGGVGFLLGNVCRSDSFVNISMNKFTSNRDDSIEIRTCMERQEVAFSSTIHISHNEFVDNHRLAIKMAPVVRVRRALIAHNAFRLHGRGVIMINNQEALSDDPFYESLEANIEISDNVMSENSGLFVASIGLQDDSEKQCLLFTRNLIEGNSINEPYPELNPRSRVAAVIAVSSSNVEIIRNNLVNPASRYEIGVHLEAHSKVINASLNYFGDISKTEKTSEIYERIFDRKNRFNLAQVEFLQYRINTYDLFTNELLSIDRERDKFIPFRKGQVLGGEVRGNMILEEGEYTVVRDIFVRPGSKLVLNRGTQLSFDQSVGLMVQGKLESVGHSFYPITFTGSRRISETTLLRIPTPAVTHAQRDSIRDREPMRQESPSFVSSSASFQPQPNGSDTSQLQSFSSISNSSTFLQPGNSPVTIINDNRNNNSVWSLEENEPNSFSRQSGPLSWYSEDSKNARTRFTRSVGEPVVRLSRGTEGRLEVLIDGDFGGVCSYGFDIQDAAVACQQLGLVLNSRDWLLEKSQYNGTGSSDSAVIITNLQCTVTDTDISKCKSEKKGEFLNSCASDVGIKCYAPSWSGIRIGMIAEEAHIENTVIEAAGLYDFATYTLTPALQIDFHRHRLRNLTVAGNLDSGIGVNWNDLFTSDRDALRLKGSRIQSNGNHGILTRSQGLRIADCHLLNNLGSGFHYDAMFSKKQQKDLISWVVPQDSEEAVIRLPAHSVPTPSSPFAMYGGSARNSLSSLPRYDFGRSLSHHEGNEDEVRTGESSKKSILLNGREIMLDPRERSFWYIRIAKNPPANFSDRFVITTKVEHGLGVMILNPIFGDATDNLTISNDALSMEWDLRRNLSAFPMLNYGFKLNFAYSAGPNPRGNILIYVAVKRIPALFQGTLALNEVQENKDIKTISLENCVFRSNGRGIATNHYNRDVGDHDEYFHRHSNETIFLSKSLIEKSVREAIFVNSPFYDPLEVSLAEINFTLVDNQIKHNNKGIIQYSRDIRNSNNLFHWIMNRTEISENEGTALLIRLPYVWQYNENFTHSISIHDNTIHRNKNFEFKIDGHYARFNMTNNSFRDNTCANGLITISGMEKEMRILDNVIEGNYGRFMIEFQIQSHADKFALVPAYFRGNSIVRNMDTVPARPVDDFYQPHSFTIALRGVQFINITRNSFSNENLQFEFLAAVLTGSLDTKINVEENWWGSPNHTIIRNRIFDFDDWNSFAIADFSPFLAAPLLDSVTIPAGSVDNFIDVSRPFGGRLHKSLRLEHRPGMPYKVNSDLTVMPGATLTLGPGAELEFFPSVGILVLGELIAAGTDDRPVLFRPQRMRDEVYRFKRADKMFEVRDQDATDLTDVRLCMTESCREWDPQRKRRDGFLEIYNRTTLQWMSVCDSRFTERNAEVICRQMGHSILNVHLRRGKRIDVGPTLISRVRYWPEPLECSGREPSIASCDVRLNGYGNHTHACSHDGEEFVYIYCGTELLGSREQYWGGIRFASATFEHRGSSIHSTRSSYIGPVSKLQHVHIFGAGILHGEKNAALQMINRDVNLEYVNVTYSSHHGIEAIAPSTHLRYHRIRVDMNLGSGLNYLLLGGASTPHQPLPYVPMTESTIPYNVYGLVDICDLNKNMIIEERVLLYYKYDNRPVDCVKIFRTKYESKPIGFRVIQFNLFNSTNFAAVPDSLKLYNGDISNITSKVIADLGVTEEHRHKRPERMFYASNMDAWNTGALSVRLHASGASQTFGFIAEVFAIPGSYFLGRNFDHNITFSEVHNNVRGAVTYKSAGETSPSLNVLFNKFELNGERMYENFTTCDSALNFKLQNTQSFVFNNNLLKLNQGGLRLETNSLTAAASLNAVLMNNLFDSNLNNEALFVKGRESGSYQMIEVSKNYFTHNSAAYKSTIVFDRVITNFTKNIVVTNAGKHQLEIIGFKRRPISYQTVRGNWFYNNFAYHLNEKSTIFASNAGQEYRNNYFVNPDNDFEFATLNRTHILMMNSKSREEREKERELDRKLFIIASDNWWGFNETSAITSRILDANDYPDLLRVDFIPFHTTNKSVLSGICSGGWESVGHTCFAYIGARMSFSDARRFCESQNSTMPFVRGNQRDLSRFLLNQQYGYDYRFFNVWVQSFDYDVQECTSLIDSRVLKHSCDDQLPFFCEKDPDIRVLIGFWYREPLGIAALTISAATALLSFCCICCWLCKSREKAKEKLQRRNSIRASIRSNRTMNSPSLASSMNDIAYKRHQLQGGSMTLTGMSYPGAMSPPIQLNVMNMNAVYAPTRLKTPSIESFAESSSVKLHPDPHHLSHPQLFDSAPPTRRTAPQSFRPLEDRFGDPALENANIDLMIRPTFDLTFENQAFKTDTPSASRASDVLFEYSDGHWTPNLMAPSTSVSRPPVAAQRPALPKRQPPPPSPSSIGQFSRRTPSPSLPQFNTYEATSTLRTYERLPQHDMLTFAPARMSKSQGSLIDDRADMRSDVTAATNVTTRTKQSQYLETSLDGESVQDNNYDYCDYQYRDDSVSMSTVSVSSKSRPLETSM